jgi:hypothetical protein
MKRLISGAAVGAVGSLCLLATMDANALEQPAFNDAPFEENWAPTEGGPDDRVGAPNRTTPEMVLEALQLVQQGKVATLGKLYAPDIPFFGPRGFLMSIPGTPTGGPFGKNALVYHDELVTTEIGQIGTQFDGPGHIGVRTSERWLSSDGRPDFFTGLPFYIHDPKHRLVSAAPFRDRVVHHALCNIIEPLFEHAARHEHPPRFVEKGIQIEPVQGLCHSDQINAI